MRNEKIRKTESVLYHCFLSKCIYSKEYEYHNNSTFAFLGKRYSKYYHLWCYGEKTEANNYEMTPKNREKVQYKWKNWEKMKPGKQAKWSQIKTMLV